MLFLQYRNFEKSSIINYPQILSRAWFPIKIVLVENEFKRVCGAFEQLIVHMISTCGWIVEQPEDSNNLQKIPRRIWNCRDSNHRCWKSSSWTTGEESIQVWILLLDCSSLPLCYITNVYKKNNPWGNWEDIPH